MMKKIVKLSLVTSVAMASMTSLNAKDLTEAIKGVDISGTVVYRYNDYDAKDQNNVGKEENKNFYKVVVNTKTLLMTMSQ